MSKKESFAKRANIILKSYERRLGKDFSKDDPLAQRGLELQLSQLKEEQEQFKIVNANKPGVMKRFGGKLPKYQFPNDENEFDMQLNNEQQNLFYNNPYNVTGNFSIPTVSEDVLENIPEQYSNNPREKELYQYRQNLTDAAPLLASLAGNALMYSQGNKEPRQLKLKRVSSDYEKVDLSREREAARRSADLARNVNVRNARNLGLSGGAAATVGAVSNVDVNRALGEQVGRSYMNEELSNTQAANQAKGRADMINSNLEAQEKITNIRQSEMSEAMKQQAIQNIIADTGAYFGDVSKKKQWTDYKQMMSPDYAMYTDPNQSTASRVFSGGKYNIKYRR